MQKYEIISAEKNEATQTNWIFQDVEFWLQSKFVDALRFLSKAVIFYGFLTS